MAIQESLQVVIDEPEIAAYRDQDLLDEGVDKTKVFKNTTSHNALRMAEIFYLQTSGKNDTDKERLQMLQNESLSLKRASSLVLEEAKKRGLAA